MKINQLIKRMCITLLGIILSASFVSAKNTWVLPQSIENIFVFIFDTLPAGVRSESTLAIVYFKFLLWIFVFAAIYSAMKKVMHDNNRLAATAALVIALSSVMLISNRVILLIFGLYSTVISIVLAILPLLVLLYFSRKLFPEKDAKSSWARGLMFIFAAMVVLFLSIAIAESGTGDMYSELARWMEISAVVLFFLGLIMFLEGAGSMVRGDYGRGSGDRGGGGGGGGDVERPPAPPDFTRQLNEIQALLERYNNEFNIYVAACNDVLLTNHNFLSSIGSYGGPSPRPSADQLQRIFDSLHRLEDLASQIDRLIREISSHADFGRMRREQMRRYNDLTDTWRNYLNRTSTFRNDFITRYSNGDPPA